MIFDCNNAILVLFGCSWLLLRIGGGWGGTICAGRGADGGVFFSGAVSPVTAMMEEGNAVVN